MKKILFVLFRLSGTLVVNAEGLESNTSLGKAMKSFEPTNKPPRFFVTSSDRCV